MKLIRTMAAGALLAAGLPMAATAQVTANVQVQVQVVGNCTLSALNDADFGSRGPVASSSYTATGSVTLTCNRGAAPLVAVGDGIHVTGGVGGQRRMSDGGGTPVYVNYNIKRPTISGTNYTVCPTFGGGSAFGVAGNRLDASAAFTATGGARTVSLCFETTLDENTPQATYTDTVQVSVTF
jgi:spore coat protein U-like protein